MELSPRLTRSRRSLSIFAAGLGLALLSGAVVAPSAAQAAEDIVVDDHYDYQGFGMVHLDTSGQRWAQPFVPTQDGALASVSVVVNNEDPYEFRGAQVHEVSSTGIVESTPVEGGIGELSFSVHPADDTASEATASFPGRPSLTAGKVYALVIDPQVEIGDPTSWPSATFPLDFIGPDRSDYFVSQEGGTGWASIGYTAQAFFTLRLAFPVPDVIVSPDAPTLVASSQCDVPGTVTIPTQNGVEFTRTDSGTDVTVTARALTGFAFPADVQTSWTFSVAAEACPVAPVAVTPAAPTVVPATCDAPGTLNLAETPGVAYVVTGPDQQTIVTASALAGYVLTHGAQTTWKFDLSALSCKNPVTPKPETKTPAATLAKTGADSSALPFAALAFMVLGAGALLARRRSLHR